MLDEENTILKFHKHFNGIKSADHFWVYMNEYGDIWQFSINQVGLFDNVDVPAINSDKLTSKVTEYAKILSKNDNASVKVNLDKFYLDIDSEGNPFLHVSTRVSSGEKSKDGSLIYGNSSIIPVYCADVKDD
ncbi:MAG: hypothetical protein A2Y17_00580 [Clostridiales bacterium GWF2_38_85]|nr:MAG: hypothetical protein A2Y17_00580 [Clostridiales bacterium GWF2_38_85]HBL84597.1 hypothetical protein [Clostridiales bacterium]